jgi:hypothetical protein
VEADAEQNYNMIDGARNNEGVPRPDLTDGQTHDEVRELAPETLAGYPAITSLAEKLTGVVDAIAARTEQSYTVDFLDIWEDAGVDLMQNSALRSAVLDALRAVPEIKDFILDKNELTVYRAAGDTEQDRGGDKFEAFIRNSEDGSRGEWLALPADAETLRGLFERIGVERADSFDMPVINTPMPHLLRRHVAGCENLDELNMLADYIGSMKDFELDKLQAVLTYKPDTAGYGTTALINLVCSDNFDAFDLIGADNAEELGRYYARENDEVPEGISFEEYGSQVSAEEGGDFTPWGYLNFRYKELLPEYTGKVSDEHKIVGAALGGLPVKMPDRLPEEKPSVLKRIRDAEKAPKPPRKNKPKDKNREGER